MDRSIPESPVEVEFSPLPWYSETIRANTLRQLEEETARLKEEMRVDLARVSGQSEQWTCTGVGDIPIAQCVDDGARLDNGLSSQPVPVRKEAGSLLSFREYMVSTNYDQLVKNLQATALQRWEARDTVYRSYGSPAYFFGDSYICGRCGEDVRLVAHCIPKQLTDGGPKRLRFPDDTVVDSLPDRREITDGSRPESASQEGDRSNRPSSTLKLFDGWSFS